MLAAIMPSLSIPAWADAINTGVTGLTAESNGKATWTPSGGTITGSVKASASSGCGGTSYSAQTGTLTFTNNSVSTAVLSFNYTLTLSGGSATVDGTSVTAGTSFSKTLNTGETVAVSITSPKGEGETGMVISNLKLTAEANVDITFKAPTNGSYTVDGTAITADTVKTFKTTDSVTLAATAANGYKFFGWKIMTTGVYFEPKASLTTSFTEACTVQPEFVQTSLPVWQVGSMLYTDLNEAISYAQSSGTAKIVLISNGTLPAGSYTIPSDKTLLIPFDEAQTVYTTTPGMTTKDDGTPAAHVTPSAFRTLTMASGANLIVASGGSLCVCSQLSAVGTNSGSWNATPTGPHGRITMNDGSSIDVQSGGKLYAWGYVAGSGNVYARSGAEVWECFQVRCWRGGTCISTMAGNSEKVFPLNQYYVQNIEAPLKLYSGATEKVFAAVNASSQQFGASATFVGAGGMFQISSGSVTKRFTGASDRLELNVDGNFSINSMRLRITGVPLVGTLDLNTADYVLPIQSNITINVNSGTTTISQDVAFLPGAEMTIADGANVTVASGQKAYVYDKDQWGAYAISGAQLCVVGYSTVNGATAKRTATNLVDAKIDVNGTLTVAGQLYTTESGAAIVSSAGTGKVIQTAAPGTDTNTYQATVSGSNPTYVSIPITAAKLQNGDGSYVETADKSAGTEIPYVNGVWGGEAGNTIEVTASGFSGTYDGQSHSITVVSDPADATVTYSTSENGPYSSTKPTYKDADTYTVYYKVEKSGYTTFTGSAEIEITKAPLTITAKDKTIIYGDAPANDGVAYAGFVNGETEAVLTGTLQYAYSYTQFGNVGTYSIIPSGLSSGNYEITYAPGTLTVDKKVVDLVANEVVKVYDGNTSAPGAGLTVNGVVNNDSITTEFEAVFDNANVGDNDVTFSGISLTGSKAGNYQLGSDTIIGKGKITPKALTITADAKTKVYGENDPELTYSSSGLVGNDTITGELTRAEGENVGEYDIKVGSLTAGDNYTISFTGAKLTITAKEVRISGLGAANKIYDGNTDATVTGEGSLEGLIKGDTVTIKAGTASFADKNAGDGKTVSFSGYALEGEDAGNYTLIQPADVTANITPKSVNVSGLGVEDKVYDGTKDATPAGLASATIDGKIGNDEVSVGSCTAAFLDKNVGDRKEVAFSNVVLTGTDAGNYTVDQVYDGEGKITKRPVTITGLEAADKYYDGGLAATVTGDAVIDNMIDGDDVTVADGSANFETADVDADKKVNFDGYSLTGNDAGNYELTAQPASVTASIFAVDVQWTAPEAIEGLAYTGEKQALITAGSAVGGEMQYKLGADGTYSPDIPKATEVGDYVVYYKVVADSNHNGVAEASITVSIGKADPTVTAPEALDRNYDGTEKPLVKAGSAVGGTMQYSLDGENWSETVPSATDAGVYGVQYRVIGDNNHKDYGPVTLNVNIKKIDPTVVKSAKAKTGLIYNGQDQELITAGEASGGTMMYSSDGERYSTDIPVGRNAQVGFGDVGSKYVIYCKIVGDNNHEEIQLDNIEVIIAPKELHVHADNKTKAYGENDPELTYTYDGLVEGDGPFVFGKLTREPGDAVGEYRIIQSEAFYVSDNYSTIFHEGTFTITRAPATVTKAPTAKSDLVYNGSDRALVEEGVADGGTMKYSLDGTNWRDTVPTGTNAGKYTVYYKVVGDGNHSDSAVDSVEVTIAQKTLNVEVTAHDKTYDGGDTADGTVILKGIVSGDSVSATADSIKFNDKNVGTGKEVTFSGITLTDASGNYTLGDVTSATTRANITAKDVTITGLRAADKVYDGTTAATVTGTAVIDGKIGDDDVTVVPGTASFEDANVGEGKTVTFTDFSLTGDDAGNYNLTAQPASVTANITAATMDVSAKGYSGTYDGAEHSIKVTAPEGATVKYSATENGDYTATNPAYKNAGTYTVYYKVEWANHTTETGSATVAINKATLTVTAEAKSKTYGEADPALTYTVEGLVTGDSLTGALTRVAGENVGEYDITVGTLSAGDNYTVSFTGAKLTITKATLTVIAEAKSKTYGEADPALTYQVSGLVNGDTKSVVTGELTRVAGENVGTYAINQGTLSAGDNYNIAFTGADFKITAKTLKITANAQTKVFGTTDPALTYTVEGLVTGDSLEGVLTRAEGENVGEYDITIGTLTAGDNYTISYTGAKLTITKATLTVTAEAKSKTYGETDPELTYTSSGLVGNDAITGELTRVAGENVGTYAIEQGTLSAGDNYNIVFSGANLTISAKALTIKADPKTKVFGTEDPALTYTVEGLVGSDALTGSLTRESGENVGTYAIKQGTLAASANYDVSFTGAEFTITDATMEITSSGYNGTYDGLPHGITVAAPAGATVTYSTAENGTYSTDNPTYTDVDTYTVFYKVEKENYTTVTGSETVVITKARLTVTAKDKTITYGDEPANDGVAYAGFVNGETEAVLTGTLQYTYGYAQFGNVGTYSIIPSGLSSGNYDITFNAGTLTVEQKTVGLTWSETSLTYNGNAQAPVATATGLVNGDVCTVTVEGQKTDVGTYTAEAKALSNGNYKLPAETTVQFTIVNASMSGVTSSDYVGTYDGQPHGITVNAPEGATVTYSASAGGSYVDSLTYVNAGEYTVYFKVVKANYETVTGSQKVTINKREVTLTWSDTSFTYDESAKCPTVAVGNLVDGDTCTAIVSGAAANAGPHTATVTGLSNDNYVLPSDNLTQEYTIAKAAKAAPEGVAAVAETYLNQKNGSITGVNGEMDYSVDGTNYVAVTGETIENLPAGTYYVRYKETENYNASPAVEITVAEGPAIKVTWKVDGQEDLVQDYAYGDTPSYGSTPTKAAEAGRSYVFAGWDPEIGTVTGDVTYTAKFTEKTCLTIKRTGAAEQDFVYSILNSSNAVVLRVVLPAGKTEVNVVGLPAGSYTVVEEHKWSWKITSIVNPEGGAVTLAESGTAEVTFTTSGSPITAWLNAFASIVKVITATNG